MVDVGNGGVGKLGWGVGGIGIRGGFLWGGSVNWVGEFVVVSETMN